MTLILSGDIRLAQGYTRPDDADAVAYIAAVEAADGQPLETEVRMAINTFVKGCKADGIWNAIKASCILAGARTLEGALVPLAGTAPNKFGTTANWNYNRKTGLQGDGSTNYLDSNRNNNADPQDSKHLAVYSTQAVTTGTNYRWYMGDEGFSVIGLTPVNKHYGRINDSNAAISPGNAVPELGTIGANRATGSQITLRLGNSSYSVNAASFSPSTANHLIFARNLGSPPSPVLDARLAFYSIGEALDLALLDTRVSDLITAFGAAIQ